MNLTRQKIITEAIKLFGNQGYAATSLETVAKALNVRKQSLLYHFGSKENLRQEAAESIFIFWHKKLPEFMQEAYQSEERSQMLFQSLIQFFTEEKAKALFIIREMIDRPTEIRELANNYLAPWIKMISDLMRTDINKGLVNKSIDPEAYILESILTGIISVAFADVFSGLYQQQTPENNRLINEFRRGRHQRLYNKELSL